MPVTTSTFRNLIGGEWVESRSGRTFASVSPADHDDVIGEFPASGTPAVAGALAAARPA
jgi:alpha-ketoglutaric semialdehyde dehydrogenase